jgi:cytochrome c oxidase subunit 2
VEIHKLEKIWIIIGIAALSLFIVVLGVNAFVMGNMPPSHQGIVDPKTLQTTPPWDKPGVYQIGPNEYEVIMISYIFGYTPAEVRVPAGSKVNFRVTARDVIHGIVIPGTNVNIKLIPGHESRTTQTFNEPGDYLIICNAYCGAGHHLMQAKVLVE